MKYFFPYLKYFRNKFVKQTKFSEKRTFLTLDTHTHVCVSGGKQCAFSRKACYVLFSCNTRFEIHPFGLLPMNCRLEQLFHAFDPCTLKISSGKCYIFCHKISSTFFGFQICQLLVMFVYNFGVVTSSDIFICSLQISLRFWNFFSIYFGKYFPCYPRCSSL